MSRLAVVALALLACREAPSDAELDQLRAEAIKANTELKAKMPEDTEGYTLTLSGQIRKPGAKLHWTDLQQLGKTHVKTINVQNPDKKTLTDFRGLLVRDVLERFDAAPGATEATFVSVDGFRATVQIADARTYRMLLAIEADGEPIPRTSGGPIFLIHPFSENGADLRWKYPDRFWAFYVTHLVVGTEEPRLSIGVRVLDRAALDQLAPTIFEGAIGWKVDWPAGTVHLRGVSLVDAIAAAGVKLPPNGRIVIRGKAPIHSDPVKPIAISIADLDRCRPVLALRWGPEEQPISAKLGGPIALAVTPCGEANEHLWITFVEEITVEPA